MAIVLRPEVVDGFCSNAELDAPWAITVSVPRLSLGGSGPCTERLAGTTPPDNQPHR